jgi:glyoxylase-like metal-dependent hydrolase (beta-lactamase superfamily II)
MKYEYGISAIDTGFFRPQFDASHLIVEQGRAAFVDVGTNYSVPGLLAALSVQGLTPADVDYVILTHVHLDHAGGAGMLMRELPNAQLVVHPRGARHMIDPAQLIAGATAVYGAEEVQRSYGELIAVPEDRVVQAGDGFVIDLAGRLLLCLDTPGHARHHICIFDERSRSFFTGDTFGLSYREFDTERGAFIIPTSTPVQFEPDAMRASIERMLRYLPEAMFLTHYSRVTDVARLAENLIEQIQAMVDIANANSSAADRHAQIMAQLGELYIGRAKAHGCSMDIAHMRGLLAMDIELNAQGLEVWLDRKKAVAA